MYAHVTTLRYWKSERADLATCEDALCTDRQRGLFCVADGAGTTLFSNIWADILVKQFVHDPLIHSDPFEMEWWIRQAQQSYREQAPQSSTLHWNARQKAQDQGAYATLASLRFIEIHEQGATAELLAIGDSCVFIGHEEQLICFPLQHTDEFDRAPYCIPALLKNLNRKTLYAREMEIALVPGDIIILATDAVARWIVSGGSPGQESNAWKAFLEVAQSTQESWPAFIETRRAHSALTDDDSTAIILQLQATGSPEELLGIASTSTPETLSLRIQAFERARAENNKEMLAITYGDGRLLNAASLTLTDAEKVQAREVANAVRTVLQAIRETLNSPQFAAKIEPLWWQYADLLMDEPCAANIRKSLSAQGVRLRRPPTSAGTSTAADSSRSLNMHNDSRVPKQPEETVPFLASDEPELARSFPRDILHLQQGSALLSSQQQAALQQFRAALATHDTSSIVNAYHPTIEGHLTSKETAQLGEARANLKLQLSTRLIEAIDRDDDDAILTTATAIRSALLKIDLIDSQIRRIEEAAKRKSALEHLLNVLEDGTLQQKVEAAGALPKEYKELSSADQEQLQMAHRLFAALHSNNDSAICSAYEILEYSPLRKHFTITLEEKQRIQQAQSERVAAQQLQTILRSDKANVALLVHTYQYIRAPHSFLTPEELQILEAALQFARAMPDEQTVLALRSSTPSEKIAYHYNELLYAPYRIVFTAEEKQRMEQIGSKSSIAPPPVLQTAQTIITIKQFLALLRVKPLYARSQIFQFQQLLAHQLLEDERRQMESNIEIWRQQIDPQHLTEGVLNDLIRQTILEHKIREEPDRSRRGLEKEMHKKLDEAFKDVRQLLSKNSSSEANQLSEHEIRHALTPFALYTTFSEYLASIAPEQPFNDWMHEQYSAASIAYYTRPEEHAPRSPYQQECWLFKWWQVRELTDSSAPQRGSADA
jgi:hypothetical protein